MGGFNSYIDVLVDIFIVGTKLPKGVPLPVVNKTIWQPAAPKAVDATRSFPGAFNRLRPFFLIISPYFSTSTTSDFPPFWVQPKDFSSNVVIPPSLFPGAGFHK